MSHETAAREEDDFDDLDDVVDQFDPKPVHEPRPLASTSSNEPSQPIPTPSSSTENPIPIAPNSVVKPEVPSEELPDELAKQLAEGMESFIRDLSEGDDEITRREAWERMLVDDMNGMGLDELLGRSSRDSSKDATGASTKEPVDDFQASILQAMEKLKDSDSTLHTNASSSAAASDDPLEAILNQLSSGLDESGEDNGELQDMLETMMQQLMSKEVLYEPLKELNDKFPSYMSENEQKLSLEDKIRFESQMIRVSAIVKVFEDPSYKEEDQEKGAQIVSLMNELQSFGSPPSEIMGPLPAGFDGAPEGCTIM